MRTALKYWAVAGTIMAVSLCDGPSAVAQDMPDDKGTLSLMLENDLFGAGTDRHFTNGIKPVSVSFFICVFTI